MKCGSYKYILKQYYLYIQVHDASKAGGISLLVMPDCESKIAVQRLFSIFSTSRVHSFSCSYNV